MAPIKFFLEPGAKTTELNIMNEGDEAVTVQLDAKQWSQDNDGKDMYVSTRDIVFFPKIAKIEKGEERVVRVGYQGRPGAGEKTYRLFIRELPASSVADKTLKFNLTLSVPVFIRPAKVISKKSIEKAGLFNGRVYIKVKNSGNAHLIVGKIRAAGLDGSGEEIFSEEMAGWYVLAGVEKTFAMDIPLEGCLKVGVIKVAVEMGGSTLEQRVDVDTAQCQRTEE